MPRRKTSKRAAKARPKTLYKSDVRLDEYDENGESLDPALGPVPAGSSSSQEGSAADGEHSREGLSVDTGVSGSKIYRCGSAVLELATANPEDITYSVKPNDIALEVECGENKATMYLSKLYQGSKGRCIEFQGAWITPNEFQAVSGRESAKDWKRSIRHRGRSLKLLFGKGVIDVHPPACRCHSCLYLQQSDGKPSVDGTSGEEGKKSPSSPKSTTPKKKKFVKKADDKDISRRDDKESQSKSEDRLRSHKSEANGEGVGPKTGSSSAESSLSSEEEDSSGDETEDDDKVAAKRARTGDLSDSKTGELKRVEAIKVKIPRNITKEETPSSSSSSSSSSDSSSDGDSDDDSDGKDDSDDDDDEDDNSEKGHVPIDPAQLNEPLFPDVKPSVYKVAPPKKKIEKEKSSSSEDDEPLAIFHRKTHQKSDEKLESVETRKGLLESSAEELIIHPDPGTRSELFTRQEPTAHQESVIHQEPQYRQEPITCQEKTAYQELITDQPLPCVSDPELTDELSPAVTCEEVKATPEHTMPEGSDAGQDFKEESEEGASEDIEMKDGMGCVQFAKEEDMADASLQEKERTESGAQPPAPQSDLTSPRAPNTPEEFQEETEEEEEEEEDVKQGEEAMPTRQVAPESEELVPGKGAKPTSEELQTLENEGTEPSASAAMTAVAKSPAEASDPGIPAPPPLTPATKVEKKSNKLSRLSNIIDNLRTSKEKQVLTGAEGERADTPERKQSPLPLPASKTSVPRPPSVAGEDRRGSGSEATPPPAHKHRSSPLFPGPPVPSSAHHHSPSPSQHKKSSSSSSSTTTSSSSAAVTSAPTSVSAAVSLGLGALPASSIFGMPAGYTPGVFGSSGSVGSKYSSSVTGTTSSSSNSTTTSSKHQAAASHSSSSTRLSSSTSSSSSSAIPSVLSSSAPSLVSVSPLLSASSMLSRQQEFALSLQRAMVHGLPPGDLNQAQLAQLAAFQMAQAEAALQQANLMAKAHASALSARSKTEHDLLAMSMLPWATRPELLMPYHITQQHLLAQQQQQLQQQQREREREREREQQKQQQQQREREQQKREREQQKQQQQQFKQDQLEVRKHQQKLLEQQQQLQQKQLFMMQQQQQQQQQKDQQRKLDAVHGQYPREGMKRPYSAMAGSAEQQQPRKAHTGSSEVKASRSGLPGNLPSAPSLKPRPSHTKENGKEGRPSSSSKHSALNLPNPLPVSPVAPPRMWVSCFPFAQPPPTMDLSRLSRFQAGSEDSGKHSTSSAAGSSNTTSTMASTSGSRGSAATSSSSSSSSSSTVSAGTVGEVLDLSVKKRKLDSR